MKSIAKRIVSLMLVMVMVIGMLPVTAFAGEAKDVGTAKYKVEIVSFIRGEVNDLRCSELLEARIYKSTDGGVNWTVATDVEGTPVSKLTYTWTNSSDSNTLMAVFLTHDLNHAYFDGDTEGGAFRGGISSTAVGAQWAAFKTPGVTSGFGFGGSSWWPSGPSWRPGGSQGGSSSSTTTFSGTATVSVRLPDGSKITDSCSDFGQPDLAADLNNIALGIFVGDETTLLSLLAESAIVHITCSTCSVSKVSFTGDTTAIDWDGSEQKGYTIIGKKAGEAELSMTVSKKNCTAHNGQEAKVSTKIFVFEKPTTSTTTTTLTLDKDTVDSRCRYYINGVEGTKQADGSIIFTGLTPDTQYTVDVVATYSITDEDRTITRYAYAYVRDTTKPVYTATVNTYLDGVKMDIEDIHGEDVALYIKEAGASEYIPLTHTGTGVYSAGVLNGTYYVHHNEPTGYHQVNNDQLIIANASGSVNIHHYSVTYNTNGGEFKTGENPGKVNYASGSAVTATANIPVRDSYVFTGWSYGGKTYAAGSTVSTGISAPMTLLAQWSRSVDVYVNVTIDHTYRDANGVVHSDSNYDNKDIVTMDLVARESSTAPYLEVGGKTLTLSEDSHIGHTLYVDGTAADSYSGHNATLVKNTVYTDTGDAAFTDLSDEYQYYLNVEKSGYDATVTAKQQSNGDWIIDVALKFAPSSSDLQFEVKMADAVPTELYPAAAIVKVLYFDTADSSWKVITQHDNGNPGVRVNITKQKENFGSYPVWATESGTGDAYGYRIMVSAFVYKDGTIVPTTGTGNTSYTDKNYTATIGKVTDGKKYGGLNGLNGAYFNNSAQQVGTLDATISLEAYDVTFHAEGGKVNGHASETVSGMYYIPAFSGYQPVMDGHTFLGWWYKDNNGNYTQRATEKELLTEDIHLYARWDQTLTGSLTVAGTYELNGGPIAVWATDRATEALVVLQEIASDTVHNVSSQTVAVTWNGDVGTSADYKFTGLDPAKQYRIDVKLVNYTTAYQNSTTPTGTYNAEHYTAVFTSADPWSTFVNGQLTFNPASYYQPLTVDATQIGSGFRPQTVLTQIWYTERNTGGGVYKVISQHTTSGGGIRVALKPDGTTNGSYGEYVWEENYNGNLYDYQAHVADDAVNALPISIHYGTTSHFDTVNGTAKNTLTATLIPNKYHITYDLNTDATGNTDVYTNYDAHTWSYDTPITYVPTREGYTFTGWTASVSGAYVDGKIPAPVHEDVTLTAQWEKADFGYTVEYYYDDVLETTVSATTKYQSIIDNTYAATTTYNSKPYALDYVTGQPLTIGTNAANNVIKVYYATDVLSDTNDSTSTPDGIPDKYQAVVTFKIVNGTWTDSTPKTRVFTLYTKNANQPWTKINPAPLMGTTPTGTANDGFVDTGSWSPVIPERVERSATYTLSFNKVSEYTVTVIVENGLANVSENSEKFSTKVFTVAHDNDLALQFTANPNFALDYVVIDGTTTVAAGATLNNWSSHTFENVTANHTIHVVYTEDSVGGGSNGGSPDNIPDKYQKKITFKVVNGKWLDDTENAIVTYVTLRTDDKWDVNGTAAMPAVPSGMKPNTNYYDSGTWNVADFPQTVSGTEPVTYTYTFKPFVYTDFVYIVEHYKQQPDGIYVLAESDPMTVNSILLNAEGNGFVDATLITATAKVYGSTHHRENTAHSDRVASGTPKFGEALTLKLFYALDSHTVKYDLNDGNATAGVSYDDETLLCGNTVTVKAAPHKIGYSFEGWKSDCGKTYAVNDVITVDHDVKVTAQWKKLDNLSYTVYYLEEETGKTLQTEKVVIGKTYQDTVASSSEVIAIPDYLFVSADPETLTISAETGKNVIKLYYTRDAVGGGSNGEDPDNIPDKYQKKITFKVVNGTWSDLTNADIVRYVTLMTAGQWDVNGTATLTNIIPTGMKANSGYGNGAWDTVPPATVSGTDEEVYTYTFKVKAPGGTPYFPPASSFDPVLSPDTGDSFHYALWIGMMCLSAVAIGGCVTVLNRRKNER